MTAFERSAALAVVILWSVALVSCDAGDAGPSAQHEEDEHDHDAEAAAATSSRVAIPAAVRSNLGIGFVKVERRRIEQTLRVPGRFEHLPTARREYRTPIPGRVELLVEQFERVEAGTPLFRLTSPAWRDHQGQLTEAVAAIERLGTRLASFGPLREAHRTHEARLQQTIAIRKNRIAELESLAEVGGGRRQELSAARDATSTAEAELAEVLEKEATLEADEAETRSDLVAARARRAFLLDAASAILSRDREELAQTVETPAGAQPLWATIDAIEVRAIEPGVVETLGLTNGSWADEKSAVLTVVRPDHLRFRASGLQSDLGVLRDGLPARVVPPTPTTAGRSVPLDATMSGTLSLGLSGDPDTRTFDLFVAPEELRSWARAGVSAQLEIVTDATAAPQLAIPLAAVQWDGLEPVFFRRDPDDPNVAIRSEADLGMDDGRWVALLSGVREGDEVVLDGAFQLMLATSGSMQRGGHFHADGTFHEGED